MAQIFVSYSRQDADAVTRLTSELHRAGHTTWFDKRTIPAGEDWKRSIERGLEDCDVVLLALSRSAATSEWVARELDSASARFKPILPAMLESVPTPNLPPVLRVLNANIVSMFPDFQEGVQKLLLDLRGVPSRGSRIPFVVDHPRLMHFVGRAQELNEIRETLNLSRRPLGLVGMGGCGKTQLAVEYAHRFRYFFPDGVFLLDGAAGWDSEFARLGVRLGVVTGGAAEPDYLTRAVAAFVAYLNEHREALLIFDNVMRPEEIVRRHISLSLTAALLPCRIIFTTRRRFHESSLRSLEIGPTDPESASVILTRGRPDLAVDADISAVCQALGHLPLALDLAGAFLRKKVNAGLRSYLNTLREHGLETTNAFARLQERDIEAYYAAALSPALKAQWSLLELSESVGVLRIVSGHPENARVPIERVATMTGLRDDATGVHTPLSDGIRDAADANLLDVLAGSTVRIHPLIRDFINRHPNLDHRRMLGDAVERLAFAYEDATELEHQCVLRTVDAVQTDVAAALGLLSGTDLDELRSRTRVLSNAIRKEAHSLRLWERDRFPAYFAQQILDRAICDGPAALAETARRRLTQLNAPHLKCSMRSRVESPELERTLAGHRQIVRTAMMTPCAKYAASHAIGDQVHVWDLELGSLRFTIPETKYREGPLGYIRRGNRSLVATTPAGGWNVETGEPDFLSPDNAGPGDTEDFAFSPTGVWAASLSRDGQIHVYDHRTGLHTLLVKAESEGRGRLAVTDRSVWCFHEGSEGKWTIRGWDMVTGALIRALEGNDGSARAFAVSQDDQKAVFLCEHSTLLQVWDLKAASKLHDLSGHTSGVSVVRIAGDNRTAVSGALDSTVIVWDLEAGTAERILFGHGSVVADVAVSPDGKTALSSSWDRTVKVWNLSGASTAKFEAGHTAAILSLDISGDGKLGLTGCELGRLVAWDLSEGRIIRTLASPMSFPFLTAIGVSQNGRWAVSAWNDGTLKLWELAQLREELSISVVPHADVAAVTDDGRWAILAYPTGRTDLHDLKSGGSKCFFDPFVGGKTSSPGSPSAVTKDAQRIVTCLNNETLSELIVTHVFTGEWQCVSSQEPRKNPRISITPDAHYALIETELFDLRTGRRACLLSNPPREILWCTAVSPNGDLAAAGFSDASLRLWETPTGNEICRISLASEAKRMSFLPDGRSLFVGDGAGGIQRLHLAGYRSPEARGPWS